MQKIFINIYALIHLPSQNRNTEKSKIRQLFFRILKNCTRKKNLKKNLINLNFYKLKKRHL